MKKDFITKTIIMDFAFTKKNYMLLFVGLEDPTKFSADIFDFQRLTLAPILLALGFVIEIFAIMYKSKK